MSSTLQLWWLNASLSTFGWQTKDCIKEPETACSRRGVFPSSFFSFTRFPSYGLFKSNSTVLLLSLFYFRYAGQSEKHSTLCHRPVHKNLDNSLLALALYVVCPYRLQDEEVFFPHYQLCRRLIYRPWVIPSPRHSTPSVLPSEVDATLADPLCWSEFQYWILVTLLSFLHKRKQTKIKLKNDIEWPTICSN